LSLVFDPLPTVLAPVSDGRQFPVRRIFCIGRNYAAHAREMGGDADREPPFYFTKWAEAVVPTGTMIAYPPLTANFHYEGELVVAIGKGGRAIAPADALDHVFGYAAGLDMTRRDLQSEAREQGRPWDIAKNVEQSAPLGLIHPIAEVGALGAGSVRSSVNGTLRQDGDLADMIWPVEEVIAYVSRGYRLEPGDLIYTGTPSGVGPVVPGDEIVVAIAGLSDLSIKVGPPAQG
jgi:fumarylpyruvate hydrolase